MSGVDPWQRGDFGGFFGKDGLEESWSDLFARVLYITSQSFCTLSRRHGMWNDVRII